MSHTRKCEILNCDDCAADEAYAKDKISVSDFSDDETKEIRRERDSGAVLVVRCIFLAISFPFFMLALPFLGIAYIVRRRGSRI